MTIAEQRSSAIAETLGRVRAIEARDGVSRASLAAIRAEMIALSARRELFPPNEFPLGQGKGERFEKLSVDPDGRFELYLEIADKAVNTLPHNHTTWAVVVGIQGLELNRLYEGEDGKAGEAPLKLREEVPVTAGSGICMMPSCLVPGFDGVILSMEWRDALWAKFATGAPRQRTPSELRYSDRRLRPRN